MAATVVSVALIVPLAVPGYMLGSWRWLRRTRSYWEVAFILSACFFIWYGALRLLGGPLALVPLAMLAPVGGFGVGHRTYQRRLRNARRQSTQDT